MHAMTRGESEIRGNEKSSTDHRSPSILDPTDSAYGSRHLANCALRRQRLDWNRIIESRDTPEVRTPGGLRRQCWATSRGSGGKEFLETRYSLGIADEPGFQQKFKVAGGLIGVTGLDHLEHS